MKKLGVVISFLLFCFSAQSQQKETFHFKFIEPNKAIINSTLTHLISIDNVRHDTVYAYANAEQMRLFEELGYKYTLIPKPILSAKSFLMATTVDQMANWDKYPTYSVYRGLMKKFQQDYPTLCKLDSIGTTTNGHKIYVVKLSNNVTTEEPEVEVFYTSTMHGDETTGYILMLRLIDSLLTSYSSSTRIASMLNGMAIYINPLANPDGTYLGGDNTVSSATRFNINGVDLNRNFPDPRVGEHPLGPWAQETQIMMNFATTRHFTLSANFHGGVEVVNYPWDAWASMEKTHPDNNWFIHLSKQYADSVQKNGPSGYFTDVTSSGYTEGADWYYVEGGRQDYMNWWQHCREVTIELSGMKLLATEQFNNLWNYNKAGLITYLESATKGFHGIVTNSLGNPLKAKVFIAGHDADSSHVYSSLATGFYARPIEPGTWQVTYSAYGYISQTKEVTVADWNSSVNRNIILEVDSNANAPIDKNSPYQLSVWPNPFSSDFNVRFKLDKPTYINLTVYSLDGRIITTLADGLYPVGLNTLNGTILAGANNGSYVVVLKVGDKSYSQIIQHIR